VAACLPTGEGRIGSHVVRWRVQKRLVYTEQGRFCPLTEVSLLDIWEINRVRRHTQDEVLVLSNNPASCLTAIGLPSRSCTSVTISLHPMDS
jgi:hypothetical protein